MMSNRRQLILGELAEGRLSVNEAERMLAALSRQPLRSQERGHEECAEHSDQVMVAIFMPTHPRKTTWAKSQTPGMWWQE